MISVEGYLEFDSLTQAESQTVHHFEKLYLFDYPYIQYFSVFEDLSNIFPWYFYSNLSDPL